MDLFCADLCLCPPRFGQMQTDFCPNLYFLFHIWAKTLLYFKLLTYLCTHRDKKRRVVILSATPPGISQTEL